MVLKEMHNQIIISCLNYQKIVWFIGQNYYLPILKKIVKYYIQNCHFYKYAKISNNKYNSLLKSLLISFYPWIDIILDFIIGLFVHINYNAILIIVNYLIKEKYYILCITNKNNTIIEAIA